MFNPTGQVPRYHLADGSNAVWHVCELDALAGSASTCYTNRTIHPKQTQKVHRTYRWSVKNGWPNMFSNHKGILLTYFDFFIVHLTATATLKSLTKSNPSKKTPSPGRGSRAIGSTLERCSQRRPTCKCAWFVFVTFCFFCFFPNA